MKPTTEQMDFIKEIEEYVKEKFSGKTKNDAILYIRRNLEEYKIQSASNWILSNGYD